MPSGSQYIGMVLWVAKKSSDLGVAFRRWIRISFIAITVEA